MVNDGTELYTLYGWDTGVRDMIAEWGGGGDNGSKSFCVCFTGQGLIGIVGGPTTVDKHSKKGY